MKTQSKKYMRMAIQEAYKNIKNPLGGPFGACIVKNGKVMACARNTALTHDATSHAEINAIRIASKKLKAFDLSDCEIYSTTEPCPMCFSAIHWARIKKIIFGTTINDVKKLGFNELLISNKTMKRLSHSKISITSGFLRKECLSLLKRWHAKNKTLVY